jgi:hypothetical protein
MPVDDKSRPLRKIEFKGFELQRNLDGEASIQAVR